MGLCCSRATTPEGLRTREEEEEVNEKGEVQNGYGGARVRNSNGYCCFASMYTQQGRKGINQDAMTMLEDFNGYRGSIFCGVFDGHGPSGHRVASHVRDVLPTKLSQELNTKNSYVGKFDTSNDQTHDRPEGADGEDDDNHENFCPFTKSKSSFISAYNEMDKDLITKSNFDTYCSGTTSVSILKQGDDLVIANIGDSRAVLCKRDHKNRPFPVQLTTDMKPNVPSESERIMSCKGRIFALPEEPDVARVWLPNENCPGLAMARAFGDFCLKDYGLISTPQVTRRKITDDDDFIVLATDGVWDVLSNNEVVRIVSACPEPSNAAKNLIEHAVRAWWTKYPSARVDDCAVICLFLKSLPSVSDEPISEGDDECFQENGKPKTLGNENVASTPRQEEKINKNEWLALEVVTRANTLVCIPRFDASQAPIH